jgi:hypothetical protein
MHTNTTNREGPEARHDKHTARRYSVLHAAYVAVVLSHCQHLIEAEDARGRALRSQTSTQTNDATVLKRGGRSTETTNADDGNRVQTYPRG